MAFTFAPSPVEDRSLRERCAGRLIGQLGPQGYVVLADGVVVGPPGVVVVTTLACTDRLRVQSGELWHGRFPLRHEVAKGRRALADVRHVAGRHHLRLPIRWFGCVVGAEVPDDPYCSLDLEFSGPADLATRIQQAPGILTFDEVLRLAHALDPARRRRSTWPSSRLRTR